MSDVTSLEGRVIGIAGAGGGLGPVVAGRLADAGATIAATDRDEARLEAVREQIGLDQERWDGRAVDLLDEDAARAWCAALVERFGHVDGLVHLVGGWKGGEPIESAPLDDYNWLHDLLVRTTQHTTRAFYDALVASGHGRFVLVSSLQAQTPEGTNAAYASTKAAAETWTLALADAFKETTATANIVVINAILTEAMRDENPDKPYRTFTPTEHIAEAIALLCSDAGDRMNGQRLALHR